MNKLYYSINFNIVRLVALAWLLLLLAACGNRSNTNAGLVNDPIFQTDPALKKITEEIGNSPKDATLFYKRGKMLHRMQLDSLALRDFRMASSIDTGKAEYYSAVGDLLFENKDLSGSVPWIQKAIAKNPNDPKARLKIAKVFLYIAKFPNAFEQINIVLRANPYEPEGYFLKGMIYKNMKDTARAISSFQTALSVAPEYRDAIIQLGLLYSDKKDPIALKYLDNAYNIDSTDVFPLFARGVYYQMKGDYELAKEEFHHCILRNNHYVDAYFRMGVIYMNQDSVQKAFRQYDIATKIDYLNPTAYYNRGVCNERMDSIKNAIADYRKALQLDSTYKSPKEALESLEARRKKQG